MKDTKDQNEHNLENLIPEQNLGDTYKTDSFHWRLLYWQQNMVNNNSTDINSSMFISEVYQHSVLMVI